MGDSAFKVKGHVVDADGGGIEDCQLERWEEGSLIESQRVDSRFLTTFTIAPGKNRFSLKLNCDHLGEMRDLGVIEIKGTEKYADPVDVGTITFGR